MDKNMSNLDRIVRGGIAAILLIVILMKVGVFFTILLAIIAIILAGTAILGVCPAYKLFHFTTKKG
jgi:hypothetical protein